MPDLTRTEAVEKVRKLRRLAASDNPHEADTARRRATEIMAKYRLAEAEVVEDTAPKRVIRENARPQPRPAAPDPAWVRVDVGPIRMDFNIPGIADALADILDPGREQRMKDLRERFAKRRRGR